MSEIDYTNIIQGDFPVLDRSQVEPTVAEVALLERTRTVDIAGVEQGTFTADTRPSEEEAEKLIDQAVEVVLADLPEYIPEVLYPRIQQAIALKAAMLIETAFYREQAHLSVKGFQEDFNKLVASIEEQGGLGKGERVDTPLMRAGMAEYQPDYVIPPPRIKPKVNIPIEDPNAEDGI